MLAEPFRGFPPCGIAQVSGSGAMAAFAADMERELRAKRQAQASEATLFGPTPRRPSQGWPLRSSIVNRPGSAASTSSVMHERGSVINAYATRPVATPPVQAAGLLPASGVLLATAEEGGGRGGLGSRSGSEVSRSRRYSDGSVSRGSLVSMKSLELTARMKQANGTLELGMKQQAPW